MSKQSSSLAVVILAAGIGSRMKSKKPKVMHELAGLPMISWLIGTVGLLRPQKIIVVAGPGMQDLEKLVWPNRAVIQKIRNGTAGALKCALPQLKGHKGPVLVLLGDVPMISKQSLQKLVRAIKNDIGIAVLGAAVADPHGYGRLIGGSNGILERIVEHKDATAAERQINLINTGAFCIDGARLELWLNKVTNKNAAKEYYITDLPEIAARDGIKTKICISDNAAETKGCNTRADLAELEETAQMSLRSLAMEEGVTLLDPYSVTLHYDTQLAPDSVIEPHVVFGPCVRVAVGARIRSFSYLEDCSIGKNATVGPFARIRPGTYIGADARIGNFVEIKKSKIGAGAKIPHLAYVGDCIMGEAANFSAGAITVNYDGKNKHKTVIGKHTMIGSNVNLVAPVKIEDGAYIAAGSTITDNVPKNALAIERGQTAVKKDWVKKEY